MAEQVELEVTPREVVGKANKRLRKAGLIPANISGHGQPSQAVQVQSLAYERLKRAHHTKNILTLKAPDAAPQTVLIRRVQHDPRTGDPIHIDFFRVSLTERINVRVPLRFEGEAPGVKDEGGVLLHLVDAVEVECVAADIVEYIPVDVSTLMEIDSSLHARDVKLPPNYTLITNPDEPIAKVAATRAEKAEEAAEEAPAASPAPAEPTTEA